jgi:uncharacterized protein (DUF362 family)
LKPFHEFKEKMIQKDGQLLRARLTRRNFILGCIKGYWGLAFGVMLAGCQYGGKQSVRTFIAKAKDYSTDLASIIKAGLRELGVPEQEIKGKRILLKPNLVEPLHGAGHINTHPLIIRGAIEAFRSLGAAAVLIAEAPGLYRDTYLVLEESGVSSILVEDRIPFVDLNYDDWFTAPNAHRSTSLKDLTLPATLKKVDWIVSMPKMKTHHWAGVTLSMKNLFGVMPGLIYGWPKNVFHVEGIDQSILDINAAVKPHFAIVDGIIGMEGDGPIMGAPKNAGVIVMGRNLPSVDATCCRIMGINPAKIRYLAKAENVLGPIRQADIIQCGETIESVRTDFELLDIIHAHRGLK